ncbi:hypothetical protein Tco_1312585 [Tanacetum coccineum]
MSNIKVLHSQVIASGEQASLVERIRSLRLKYLKVRAMLSIEKDQVDSIRWHMALSQKEFRQAQALAAHEETRAANALEAENQSQNGSDGGNGDGGNGNGKNGNGNLNENGRGDRPVA